MLHNLFKNLLLHGGEGGDGASAAPSGETAGAEETGVTAPDAGEKTANRRPNKAERRAALEAKLQAERAAAQPQQNQQTAAQQQPEKRPFDEIEQLYHDEIGQKIQTAIQGRFKNQTDNAEELNSTKAELEKQSKLLAALAESQYGIKPGADGKIDLAAIEGKVNQSRAEEYALENGVSEEFASERLEMEARIEEQDRQLRELQAAEEQRQKDEADHARFLQHQEQAAAFREKMPGFDLIKEMEASPVFTRLINNGIGVESAYYAVHHKELMAVGQQAAAIQAQRALAASIQAGQSMPTEGGLGRSPAANPGSVVDPHAFTKENRRELRRRVARGEKVYL
ncbi:MAG: hypothetical protein VZQ75_00165 [Candidatus Faecousia sp.]|nr:hypothetical protein [Candidatus Faecousia sp.]